MDISNVLTKEARDQGFTLTEPHDHVLELRQHDQVIARFTQTGVEVDNILKVIEHINEN